MDDYNLSSMRASRVVTETFSTSFSSAITLFAENIRQDIYNIYGLVRVADEIVDTYQGQNADKMLDDLEAEVQSAIDRGFSSNVIVHAFALTASKYSIDLELVKAFFESMRMDLTKKIYNQEEYKQYIYGSAEVVGLMCLYVFVAGDKLKYDSLKTGAAALGSAFQKVNFLRDIKDDHDSRGRYYFPHGSYEKFSEEDKAKIIDDIEHDFAVARPAIDNLPDNSRFATNLAYSYYRQLLIALEQTPASQIKLNRISVARSVKLKLLLKAKLKKHGK